MCSTTRRQRRGAYARDACGGYKCENWTQRTDLNADALAFGETRRIKRTETRRDCWKISEKGASAHLRALARFKIAKKGRCDAEDAADEIRRENGEKTTQLYLNSLFFILHSSFFIYYNALPPRPFGITCTTFVTINLS